MPSTPIATACLRVGNGLDPLQDDRSVPDRTAASRRRSTTMTDRSDEPCSQPATSRAEPSSSRRPTTFGEHDRFVAKEVERPRRMDRSVDNVRRADLRWQSESPANVSLAAAEHRGVDCQPDRRVPGRLGSVRPVPRQADGPARCRSGTICQSALTSPRRLRSIGCPSSTATTGCRRAGPPGRPPAHPASGRFSCSRSARGSAASTPVDPEWSSRCRGCSRREGRAVGIRTAERVNVALHGSLVLGSAIDVVEDAARQPPPREPHGSRPPRRNDEVDVRPDRTLVSVNRTTERNVLIMPTEAIVRGRRPRYGEAHRGRQSTMRRPLGVIEGSAWGRSTTNSVR